MEDTVLEALDRPWLLPPAACLLLQQQVTFYDPGAVGPYGPQCTRDIVEQIIHLIDGQVLLSVCRMLGRL